MLYEVLDRRTKKKSYDSYPINKKARLNDQFIPFFQDLKFLIQKTIKNDMKRKLTVKNFWSYDSEESNVQIPLMKDLERVFKERVIFQNINAEENKDEVEKYGIKEFPTIIIECDGKERERFNGLTQELFLKKAIERALSECR